MGSASREALLRGVAPLGKDAITGEARLAVKRFTTRPKGATRIIPYGVAALEKDMPFPADCALSWIIRVALNP